MCVCVCVCVFSWVPVFVHECMCVCVVACSMLFVRIEEERLFTSTMPKHLKIIFKMHNKVDDERLPLS